jgi:hypothetical protein
MLESDDLVLPDFVIEIKFSPKIGDGWSDGDLQYAVGELYDELVGDKNKTFGNRTYAIVSNVNVTKRVEILYSTPVNRKRWTGSVDQRKAVIKPVHDQFSRLNSALRKLAGKKATGVKNLAIESYEVCDRRIVYASAPNGSIIGYVQEYQCTPDCSTPHAMCAWVTVDSFPVG